MLKVLQVECFRRPCRMSVGLPFSQRWRLHKRRRGKAMRGLRSRRVHATEKSRPRYFPPQAGIKPPPSGLDHAALLGAEVLIHDGRGEVRGVDLESEGALLAERPQEDIAA